MTLYPNRSATLPEAGESVTPANINDSDFIYNGNVYQHGRAITVAEQAGSSLSNYLVMATFGSNLDFASTQANGEDLRFLTVGGSGVRYWVERWDTTNNVGVVWLEVPSIPANGSTDIFMLYGNSSVAAQSTTAIWTAFDDFTDSTPLSEWSQDVDTWSVDANSRAYGDTDEGNSVMTHSGSTYTDIAVESAHIRLDTADTTSQHCGEAILRYDRSTGDGYMIRQHPDKNALQCFTINNNSYTKVASVAYTHSFGEYRATAAVSGSSLEYVLYDTARSQLASFSPSDTTYSAGGYAGIRQYESEERQIWWATRPYVSPEPTVSVGAEGDA